MIHKPNRTQIVHFIGGLLIGIIIAIPVHSRFGGALASVAIGVFLGSLIGLLLAWLAAYLVVKFKS